MDISIPKGQQKQLRTYNDLYPIMQEVLNIEVVDHYIITEKSFYSFSNAGLMKELAKSGLYEVTHKESEEMKAWREEELAKRAKDKPSREMAAKTLADGLDVDTGVKYSRLRKSSVEKMKQEIGKQGVFPVA